MTVIISKNFCTQKKDPTDFLAVYTSFYSAVGPIRHFPLFHESSEHDAKWGDESLLTVPFASTVVSKLPTKVCLRIRK